MPIRPENLARYPKTWREMVAAARVRSGNRCECVGQCGLNHGAGDEVNSDPPRCRATNGEPHPLTGSKVVLTLAHEHGVPLEETTIDRMFHACQQCHLRYDKDIHRQNSERTRREQKGNLELFK